MENGFQWLFINNNNNKVNNILHCSYITKICVWNKMQFNFSLGMEIKWTKPPLQYKYISASGILNQIKIETTTTTTKDCSCITSSSFIAHAIV